MSVVVLCYNVADYLDKCLKSIRLQTLRDFECIVVDDGSTDGSAEICRRHASEDARFRLISLRHGGITAARKAAYNAARGAWCACVDGDDWVGTDMLEKMVSAAIVTGADFVQCRQLFHYKSMALRKRITNAVPRPGERHVCRIDDLRVEDWLEVSLRCTLLKTDRLRRIFSRIDDDLIFCEDAAAVSVYAADSESVCMLGDELCHYRMRKSSSTSMPSQRSLDLIYGIHDFIAAELRSRPHGASLLPRYSAYLLRHCIATIALSAMRLDAGQRTRYMDEAMADGRFQMLLSESDGHLSQIFSEKQLGHIESRRIPDDAIERMRMNMDENLFD